MRIPSPAGVGISRDETRSAAIVAAASATVTDGATVTGARRTSDPIVDSRASGVGGSARSAAASTRRRMLPTMKWRPAGVSSTSSATSSGIT